MAKAKSTSPATPAPTSEAKPANKPIHRLRSGNVLVTVWEGPRVTLQREYRFDNKIGYADSFRVEDTLDLKRALDQFVIWAETPQVAGTVPHTQDVTPQAA